MLRVDEVHKSYASGEETVRVLKGVSLNLERGEIAALMGPSGVGKSTLLHLAAGLDRPDSGSVEVNGSDVTALKGAALDAFRRRTVGVVYQFHFLLPEFTALENVLLPAVVAGNGSRSKERARALLAEVGLSHRERHVPSKLSGGEQQRAAIARALMNSPALLLADEPTGNLDEESAAHVFGLLRELKARHGLTVLMATHNASLAAQCDRIIRLSEGRVAAG